MPYLTKLLHDDCGGRLTKLHYVAKNAITEKRSGMTTAKYFICHKCSKIVEVTFTQRDLQ